MSRGAGALIDLAALRHNLGQARRAAPDSRVMAVIKANAYGHGLLRVAGALREADAFAVASVEEARELREAGIDTRVVVLEGFFDRDDLEQASRLGLELVVHHEEQLALLERTALARPVTVWLKVDSGMHRLGFSSELVAAARERLRACAQVAAPLHWMTHLACADDRRDPRTERQLQGFRDVLGAEPGERSVANSAGILGWPATHAAWNRPGIMLYGASPFIGGRAERDDLRPVMTLSTRLIAVNQLRKGDAVGYGAAWVCPEDMPVGVAAIGYGDGYPRHAKAGTPVLVNGRRAALVGRVSMDMICLDLRGYPAAHVGDPVVLWGEGLPVEEVARHAGTIPYELLCGVTARVPVSERDGD